MNSTNPANQTVTNPPPPQPTKVYFYKELWGNFWYIGGKPVPFEQLDGNRGVIALDSTDAFVPGLEQAAKDQVGGIIKINAQTYAEKKSRFPFQEKPKEMLAVAPRQDQAPKKTSAFRPPPPTGSPESAALADMSQTGEQKPPAAAPNPNAEAIPQAAPQQPDFKTDTGQPKFNPRTARAGTGKAQEPTPV